MRSKHIARAEIVEALRDCLSVAEARRAQYRVPPLKLYGEAFDAKQSLDVISGLRYGQLVALSATLVQEIVNYLGTDKEFRDLPTAVRRIEDYQLNGIKPTVGT